MKPKTKKSIFVLFLMLIIIIAIVRWSDVINLMLPADSRPDAVVFDVERITAEQFDAIAKELQISFTDKFDHVKRFKDAGILAYEGPKTCLQCHEQIKVMDAVTGKEKMV